MTDSLALALKEYELGWQRLNFIEGQAWNRTLVIFGISLGAAIGVSQFQRHDISTLMLALGGFVLGGGNLFLFLGFLERQRFVVRLIYNRLHELEIMLGRRLAIDTHFSDNWDSPLDDPFASLMNQQDRIRLLRFRDRAVSPRGWRALTFLTWSGIFAWWFLVLRETFLVWVCFRSNQCVIYPFM